VQDIAGDGILVAGMADAQPDPPVSLAQMGVDRPQAVVPGMTAALLQPALARGQIKFIVKDGDVGGRQLPEIRRRADRLTRQVHEGLGLQQHHLFRPQAALADLALMRLLPGRKPVVGGDPVQRHEADVVAVPGVFRARISKTHPEFHRPALHGWTREGRALSLSGYSGDAARPQPIRSRCPTLPCAA
jgi:hypothetical protein